MSKKPITLEEITEGTINFLELQQTLDTAKTATLESNDMSMLRFMNACRLLSNYHLYRSIEPEYVTSELGHGVQLAIQSSMLAPVENLDKDKHKIMYDNVNFLSVALGENSRTANLNVDNIIERSLEQVNSHSNIDLLEDVFGDDHATISQFKMALRNYVASFYCQFVEQVAPSVPPGVLKQHMSITFSDGKH